MSSFVDGGVQADFSRATEAKVKLMQTKLQAEAGIDGSLEEQK